MSATNVTQNNETPATAMASASVLQSNLYSPNLPADESSVNKFLTLFPSRPTAVVIGTPTGITDERGKSKYTYYTRPSGFNRADVGLHLAGQKAIVGIPLLPDNTCLWASGDIHEFGINLNELRGKVAALDLPLYVFPSKSKGAHLFAFFPEPRSAALVRALMADWMAKLGYPGVEVFPKQDMASTGNGINLPFFGSVEGLDEFNPKPYTVPEEEWPKAALNVPANTGGLVVKEGANHPEVLKSKDFVDSLLERAGVDGAGEWVVAGGGYLWKKELPEDACPNHANHSAEQLKDTFTVLISRGGVIGANCQHGHCSKDDPTDSSYVHINWERVRAGLEQNAQERSTIEPAVLDLPSREIARLEQPHSDYIDQLAEEITRGTPLPFSFARETLKLTLLACLPESHPRFEHYQQLHTRIYTLLLSDEPGTGKFETWRRVKATLDKAITEHPEWVEAASPGTHRRRRAGES